MDQTSPKPRKKSAKRVDTENRILHAFERLLIEGGSQSIGVNSLIQEAGVAKGLIYKYFGGLEGVAQQWMEQYRPGLDSTAIKGNEQDYLTKGTGEKLASIMNNYIQHTRNDAVAMELLSEEVSKNVSLSDAYAIVRGRLGKEFESILMTEQDFADPKLMPLIMILHAASNYLALRSQYQPNFNGIDLSEEAGKHAIESMINTLCDTYVQQITAPDESEVSE